MSRKVLNGLDVAGQVAFSTVATVALVSASSPYNDLDIGEASTLQVTSDNTNPTLSGFTGGTAGRVLVVSNADPNDTFTLAHQYGGSTAANRLYLVTQQNTPIYPGESVLFVYDAVLGRWRQVSSPWSLKGFNNASGQQTQLASTGGWFITATGGFTILLQQAATGSSYYGTPHQHIGNFSGSSGARWDGPGLSRHSDDIDLLGNSSLTLLDWYSYIVSGYYEVDPLSYVELKGDSVLEII